MTENAFPSWPDTAPELINVAAGRAPADTVIRQGKWVNVHTSEVLDGHDIAIKSGRIAYVGPDASYCTGPETMVRSA